MSARIDSFQLATTLAKIEKINARAEKRGLSGRLALDVTEVEITTKDDLGFEVTEVLYDVFFTGEAPKHNGWIFLATLDWDANAGLIVRTAPGVHSVDREGLREGACDHCRKDRMRKETFLVKHEETGEEKQIGRSCIKDFLGHTTDISWPSGPLDEDEEKEWYGFGGGERDYSTETVLAYAWACVKAFGFVRSQDYHATPTVQLVRNAINPGKGRRDKEFADAMRPLAAEAKGKAAEIRAFILSDDFSGTSEYVLNLKAIAAAKSVSSRNFGILVSAPQAWARFNEQTLIRKARNEKPSEWIGTAPDKAAGVKGSRITFTGMVESIRYIDGVYGSTTLYQVRDELSGVIVKWFASNNALGENTGVRVTFRGTVKGHDEYKGIKATVLTRCTLVETAVPEPKAYEIDAPKKPRTPRKKTTPAPAPAPVAEVVEEAPSAPAEPVAPRPHEAAYNQYVSDGLADTDGYFAPLDYDAWAAVFAPAEPEIVEEVAPVSESDSAAESASVPVRNPLEYFDGGADGIVRLLAENEEDENRFRARLDSLFAWVRLGDDVERVTMAEAYDLLGAAYAEGADWLDTDGIGAADWGGLVLAVGRDALAPTV